MMMKLKKLKFFVMIFFLCGFFVLNSANTCEDKKEKTEEAAEGEHPSNGEHPKGNDEHPSTGDEEHPDN